MSDFNATVNTEAISDDDDWDLFGGLNVDEVPDSFDLPDGFYENVIVDKIEGMTSKNDDAKSAIAVTYKNLEQGPAYGLTHFEWLGVPVTDPRHAARLKRSLVALGFEREDMRAVNACIEKGTTNVDIKQLSGVVAKFKGTSGTLLRKTKAGKNQKGEEQDYTNITFERHEDQSANEDTVYNPQTGQDVPASSAATNSSAPANNASANDLASWGL